MTEQIDRQLISSKKKIILIIILIMYKKIGYRYFKMYCKEKLFDRESQKFMYFLDEKLLSIYGLQKHSPSNLHTFVYTKNCYVSRQIIKVCNSTAIVLFASQNFLHEWINVRWRPEKLQSNNCHLRDDDRQAEPKLHILSNNQGAHEGINSIHLSVENDSEVMSCYYQ